MYAVVKNRFRLPRLGTDFYFEIKPKPLPAEPEAANFPVLRRIPFSNVFETLFRITFPPCSTHGSAGESSAAQRQHGKSVSMGDKELMWALKNGDLDEVKTLLKKDEDVNRTLESGRKPLHYATDCGQAEMVEFLLSKGADVNAPDKHGITPLLSATYEGHLTCVRILLEKGADKERKGPDGLSAFEAAESEAIKALLK
ncbi:hypothetical protein AMELA_G00155710 [Ameiurus melas]|uniref:Myotrophin n=1 Tax=Ameiurus melas TaxID=219545 RepID=A0A7J6AGM4_AMEME|nr:hypothetical protein AMELA_G00155710 [Ameiurus melas]